MIEWIKPSLLSSLNDAEHHSASLSAAQRVTVLPAATPQHTVKFLDHDGTLLSEQTVPHGQAAAPPAANPSHVGLLFDRWDRAFDNVTSDLNVTALYIAEEDYLADNNITIEITADNNTHGNFKNNIDEISVDGAAFSAEDGDTLKLHFSKPPNEITVDESKYEGRNAVQVDIKLIKENGDTVDTLAAPIAITVPIPSGIKEQDFVILHYFSYGGHEVIKPTLNGDGTCTFIVTRFSLFVFVNGRAAPPVDKKEPQKNNSSGNSESDSTVVAPVIYGLIATPIEGGASLFVNAYSSGHTQTYQWQLKQPDGQWANLPGTVSASFELTGLTPGESYIVRCVVRSTGNGVTYSSELHFNAGEAAASQDGEAAVITPYLCQGIVLTGLNVRPEPNTKKKGIGKLRKNEVVTVLDYVTPKGYAYGFYKIQWPSTAGYAYIAADYVDVRFRAPLTLDTDRNAYVQSRKSESGRYRRASLQSGESIEVIGRYRKWWIVAWEGEPAYILNTKYILVP